MDHHTKFPRFPATGTACLACGIKLLLAVPYPGRQTCSAGDIGTAATLLRPITKRGHRLSSLIWVTVALQSCRQSGHKLSSPIQVTVTYHPHWPLRHAETGIIAHARTVCFRDLRAYSAPPQTSLNGLLCIVLYATCNWANQHRLCRDVINGTGGSQIVPELQDTA